MNSHSETLTDILERLCEISRSQLEALDREDYVALRNLLDHKDILLQRVTEEADSLNGAKPSTEQKKLLESFNAHEAYVRRQLEDRTQEISERLNAVSRRRKAAKSYGKSSGNYPDWHRN